MEWIKCTDKFPEKDLKSPVQKVVVLKVTPATPDMGFFKGVPETKEVLFAFWTYRCELFPCKLTTEESIFKNTWGFVSNVSSLEYETFIENVTHWMPLPPEPEEL